MTTILDRIVEAKIRELETCRQRVPMAELERKAAAGPAVRDFLGALTRPGAVRVIAEVKKASPSAGTLKEEFDPVAIAGVYDRHGAAAVSVLTDEPHFQGSLSHLTAVRQAVSCPVLRKDFILDPYQVVEARAAGADAVLLIAEILDDNALSSLLRATHALGMEALVELYEPVNLPRVVASGARVIGINNRDLRSFVTRLEHTLDLANGVPADRCLVSESGIRTRADVARLAAAGVRAVLVGETLMRAEDVGAKLEELAGVKPPPSGA